MKYILNAKSKKMRIFVSLVIILFLNVAVSASVHGRLTWAIPTQIDIEKGDGFMVYGAFGNPGECTRADRFFVKKSHAQYDKIYAAALSALTAKREMRAYIHGCEPILWYSVGSVTYNILSGAGDFNIR